MRDQQWLETRFDQLWGLFFPEVERKNISIRWKGRWKNKFGHITSKNGRSEIVVNRLFQDVRVPEDIVKLTIAHEIVHYAHGFHSHLPKKYNHPHKGGVVDKELIKKGFSYTLKREREWYKTEWLPLFRELCPQRAQGLDRRRVQRRLFSFRFWQ